MTIFGFEIEMSVFWLIVAVVFAIIEALTMGLTTIWFTGGAVVSLVIALAGGGTPLQVVAFFVVSIILLIFTRKIFMKKLHTGEEKTNVEALIGEEAIVTACIKPLEPGRIKLRGQDWTAITSSKDESIEEGTHVKVIKIEGVKAVVKALDK
ncbi:MAG TPA: NfeD family protein [Anaerovoracaceae bacterium]|nr:NfeD family protein [Anaerovoracaceae bacterium]